LCRSKAAQTAVNVDAIQVDASEEHIEVSQKRKRKPPAAPKASNVDESVIIVEPPTKKAKKSPLEPPPEVAPLPDDEIEIFPDPTPPKPSQSSNENKQMPSVVENRNRKSSILPSNVDVITIESTPPPKMKVAKQVSKPIPAVQQQQSPSRLLVASHSFIDDEDEDVFPPVEPKRLETEMNATKEPRKVTKEKEKAEKRSLRSSRVSSSSKRPAKDSGTKSPADDQKKTKLFIAQPIDDPDFM
jgi:hypothetical protein